MPKQVTFMEKSKKRTLESMKIEAFCNKYCISYEYINYYQIRLERKLDLYPTSKKYGYVGTSRFGKYSNLKEVLILLNW